MTNLVNNIVIVGGGTAGWLVASRLAAKYQHSANSEINITLVESPDIKPIGVGEGTWPSMRSTLNAIGLSESDLMRECDATFKQGSRFTGWLNGEKGDSYYHPFMLPQGFNEVDMLHYLAQTSQENHHHLHSSKQKNSAVFADMVCPQTKICESFLAPKQITTPEYAGIANYGYHLNAGKFAGLLQRHCLAKFKVKHVLDNVIGVNGAENGDIKSVTTKKNGEINGDLFIDCSGFSCLLLGGFYRVPFVDQSETLFVDTALAVQVPYENANSEIASVTRSTATMAGWIWDIGLSNRKGIGHVYSSAHCTESRAEEALVNYLGKNIKNIEIRKIAIKSGHRKQVWKNNCVAIGLSAGFLEPLEASAIVQVELAADSLCRQLPATRDTMELIAKRFNEAFCYRWAGIIDFLKLHYVLSKRTDSDFWLENRHPDSIPESLQELLALWRHHYPGKDEFPRDNDVFGLASYQYILAGMGFKSASPYPLNQRENEIASLHLDKNAALTDKCLQHLPGHRELINKMMKFGFQVI